MKQEKRYRQYMYSYPHKLAYREVEKREVIEALEKIEEKALHLYIHIPFCKGHCGYCNLFAIHHVEKDLLEAYVDAMIRQIQQYANYILKSGAKIESIIFGGGTPFVLDISHFDKLFTALEEAWCVNLSECRIDIETSPRDTSQEKIDYLMKKGLFRISIGVQSFVKAELKAVRRGHDKASCEQALGMIQKAKPKCFNIDLIYGIEGQSIDSFLSSIETALSYEPSEIFLYPLYIRPKTPLYGKMQVQESLQYEMYQKAVSYLKEKGYHQSSMRRFVKRKEQEVSSCGFEQSISIGCGGRSYLGDLHFCTPYDLEPKATKQILKQFCESVDFTEGMTAYRLDREECMRRFVVKNLAFHTGLNRADFQQMFQGDVVEYFSELFQKLEGEEYIYYEKQMIKMTEKGFGNADQILSYFISEKVRKGMQSERNYI